MDINSTMYFNQIPLQEITKYLDYYSFESFRNTCQYIRKNTANEEILWKVRRQVAAAKIKDAMKRYHARAKYVRLPFWFSHNPQLALPFVAMQDPSPNPFGQQIRITVPKYGDLVDYGIPRII